MARYVTITEMDGEPPLTHASGIACPSDYETLCGMSGRDEYVTVTARLKARTAKAVLLNVGKEVERGGWVPRSCLHFGGLEKNKHESKKLKAGRGAVGKSGVLAMRQRGGKMVAMQIEDSDAATLHTAIHQRVVAGSEIHTDEAAAYKGIGGLFFAHETVNHGDGEYVRDHVTTNGVESVFAVMKRGIHGVYHHASKKHLHRYVDEFTFRLNDGNVSRHTLERLDSFVDGVAGKRLTYKELIH